MVGGNVSCMVTESAYPHFVSLHLCWAHGATVSPLAEEDWAGACYRLTERVVPLSARHALLDLGVCTDSEAVAAAQMLLRELSVRGWRAYAGIGPSFSLAQLAVRSIPRSIPAHTRIVRTPRLVTPAETLAFLHRLPVTLLLQVYPLCGITPAIIDRLRRYGLETLGHIARLDEATLRRQFGPPGAALAALAAGRDPFVLQPVPRPPRLIFRLRLDAATPDCVLAAVPHFIARIACHLQQCGRQIRELRLTLWWESGSRYGARATLRQYCDAPALLTAEVRRLLLPVLQEDKPVAELRIVLLDFAAATPAQSSFAPPRAQRMVAVEQVADTLARRHGRPILLSPRLIAPDAIFAEERHCLTTIGTSDVLNVAPRTTPSEGHSGAARSIWDEIPHRMHWW